MVSQFAVRGTDPVDMAIFFCRETSPRKKEMTWQKWVTRQRWMDRWDPWGVFIGDSMSCLQKLLMFEVKKATPRNTWRVLWEVFYMWGFFFSRKRDMLNGEFPGRYINDIWENGFGGHGKHVISDLSPWTLQALKKYEKGIRLLGWPAGKKLEVGDLDVTNSCWWYLFIIRDPCFFVWVFVPCCFFWEGKQNKKPWRIMSWWKLIKWLEWMGWEPLKRRKEKVVLVVLQLKTTSYSASLYSKIGHHMFSRSTMNIKNMFLQKDGLKKDFSFKYIWCPISSTSSFASLWTLVCLCFHTGHAFLIEILPTTQRGTVLFQVF